MSCWSQKASAQGEADPCSLPLQLPNCDVNIHAWITAKIPPEASQLSASFSLACGYRNYRSLNGQSFSESQNKYLHPGCNYESNPGTRHSLLTSLFLLGWAVRCCQTWPRALPGLRALRECPEMPLRRGNRLRHVRVPVPSQDRIRAKEGLSRSILPLSAVPVEVQPKGRRFGAAPVLNRNTNSIMQVTERLFHSFSFFFFPPRFLLLPSKMPTSSYRLTMPGWRLMTSEPSKCNAFQCSWEQGGKSQPV